MPYQALDLTFGIEVEFILGFEESMLQEQLEGAGDASRIVKDLTEEHRTKLRTGTAYALTRRQYKGWALTSKVEPLSAGRPAPQIDPYLEAHREFGFRAYADEVSYIAQALLTGPPDVQSICKDGKRVDVSRRYLSDDQSLLRVDKSTILASLGNRVIDVDNWASHGVELVSRPLPATLASFDEIQQHLDPLRGTDSSRHGAIITPHCALHVHVEFPDPAPGQPRTTFGLSILQHLTYLLVMYEAQISRMHPSSRRAGSDATMKDCMTNLDEFAEASINASYQNFYKDYFKPNNELQEYNELKEPVEIPISYQISRGLIFTSEMTIAKLVKLMCCSIKDHIINFTYLLRPAQAARTLEFRQHEGKGYPRAEYTGEARLEELWELMGFEQEGRSFYEQRMESVYDD